MQNPRRMQRIKPIARLLVTPRGVAVLSRPRSVLAAMWANCIGMLGLGLNSPLVLQEQSSTMLSLNGLAIADVAAPLS